MVLRDANYVHYSYDSDNDFHLLHDNTDELHYFRVVHDTKHLNTEHYSDCNYTFYNHGKYGFYHYNHTYDNDVDSNDGVHHINDAKYNNVFEFNQYTDHNDINKYKYGNNDFDANDDEHYCVY